MFRPVGFQNKKGLLPTIFRAKIESNSLAALRPWQLNIILTICLSPENIFMCGMSRKSLDRQLVSGHALHEKGLQRQQGVGPLVSSQKRRAGFVPRITA